MTSAQLYSQSNCSVMSFINSKPVLLDTIFPYKVICPVVHLFLDYNVFQRNCKIIPLKPCVGLLLKTGK